MSSSSTKSAIKLQKVNYKTKHKQLSYQL